MNIRSRAGFTMLEMLAAMTITVILVLLLTSAFNQTSRSWLQSENRIETATQARVALQYMTTILGQAIVSPVYDFIGQSNIVAFVAVTGGETWSQCDLEENVFALKTDTNTLSSLRVYNQSFRTLAQVTNMVAAYTDWDVQGKGAPPSGRQSASTVGGGWPCTVSTADQYTLLMRNVLSLQFQYFYTNTVTGSSGSTNMWNSAVNTITPPWSGVNVRECSSGEPAFKNMAPGPAYQLAKIPYGVLITLTAVDQRAAARLAGLTAGSAAYNNITNQSARTYSAFALINYQKE